MRSRILSAVVIAASAAVLPAVDATATPVLGASLSSAAAPVALTGVGRAGASPARSGRAARRAAIGRAAGRQGRGPRAAARPAAPANLERVERHFDSSGWAWRNAGLKLRAAHHPQVCCHWGVYDYRNNTVWIAPSAFASDGRLRYVALHELAHAWQWASGQLSTIVSDMSPWGRSRMAAIEAQADCVAAVWGSGRGHYWSCPSAAREVTARRLRGDWT